MKLNHLAPNQTELYVSGWVILFSYSTPVAALSPDNAEYRTGKHLADIVNKHIDTWINGKADVVDQSFFDHLTDTICKER